MINTLFILTICLVVSFIFSEIFFRLKYPRVLGQILAGIFFGIPLISGLFFPEGSFLEALGANNPAALVIDALSGLGIIFLLLLTGLEVNYEKLKKVSKDTALIGAFGLLIPLFAGFLLMKFLGFSDMVALIAGICLSVTSEATAVAVLMESKKLNTKVGEIILGAGFIDTTLMIVLLSGMLIYLRGGGTSHLIFFLLELVLFIFLAYLFFKIFPSIVRYIQKEKSEVGEFTTVILVGLFIASLSSFLVGSPIIGALLAGIIIQLSIRDKKEEKKMINDLKIITFSLVVPFFFLTIGLNFDFHSILGNPLLVFSIILIAMLGKLVGCLVVKPLTKLKTKQLYLIGWGMNSRGAIELVIVAIAYPILVQEGALNVFSAIVIMAIVTTLIFPLILRYYIRKYPRIMN